ncbi:hypothetical protein ACFQ7F_06280 [Streptomyces sp. NPDC056486]|uniref:hypothetical protein n=1 Tax=Streptomyces sp. NPDC056486 TaxID=3345835 RepID=UPI0036A675D7
MRIHRAIATAAVGAALALGGSAGSALAASPGASTTDTAASSRVAQWEGASTVQGVAHYWATYNSMGACTAAAVTVVQSNPDRYYHAECTEYGTKAKLWVWY